jgi:hypothetical protein
MLPYVRRVVAAALPLVVSAACADNLATTDRLVAPNSARMANSSESPYTLSESSLSLRPGQTHQVLALNSATGKPVPDPSIRWSSSDETIATVTADGLVGAVSVGTATVSATRGAIRQSVLVTVVDPCARVPLPLGVTAGEITPDDCVFSTVTGRRTDYFSLQPAAGEIVRIRTTGVSGPTGIKQETTDPRVGTVFASRDVGLTYRMVANGDPLQFFLSGRDGSTFGAYTIERSIDTQAFSCGILSFMMPGASVGQALTAENSCHVNVAFSPVPQAIGKPLYTHRYFVRLDVIKPYTVTLGGLTTDFDVGLTIFPNVANAGPVAQAVASGSPPPPSRSVTFTPASTGFYLVEISSGRFIGGFTNWVNQIGSYTLSVSR